MQSLNSYGAHLRPKTTRFTAAALIGLLCTAPALAGGIFTVNSTADPTDPAPGAVTLREAIESANGTPGSRVEFDPNVFSTPQTIVLQAGELRITADMELDGPGAHLLTLDGNNASRVLTVSDEFSTIRTVFIRGLTFTRGNGASTINNDRGGCIMTLEHTTIQNTVVHNCSSSVDGGGVFSNAGQLILDQVNVNNNTATFKGGGVFMRSDLNIVNRSTFHDNTAKNGAGLFTLLGGTVFASTFSGNTSTIQSNGAAIDNNNGGQTNLSIADSTVINNNSNGLMTNTDQQKIFISNSIIAHNSFADCEFTDISAESDNIGNLDSDGSCNVFASNHTTVAEAKLGPLQDNGGFTPTHRPLADSPVIDANDAGLCDDLDQRGFTRPFDGDADGTVRCDIGAVEIGDLLFKGGFESF